MPSKYILLLALLVFLAGINVDVAEGAAKGTVDSQPQIITIDRTDYPALYPSTPPLEGEAVWMVQARLKELGYDITPNGQYNSGTWGAIRMYQIAHGFKDDAVVTKPLWVSLMQVEQGQECAAAAVNNEDNKKVTIVIDVAKRNLTVYEKDVVIRTYPVAVGKEETPTPLGEWKVVQKSLNWGNGFGTRWLGLNVPWGIFGIHGTDKPYSIGTYASHGCIRMFNRDVEKLYPIIPMGATVRIVKNGRIVPDEFKTVPMKKGSYGQKVVYVQSRLKDIGVVFDSADGRYGAMTEFAVKYFQAWHALPITGEMDEATYRAMGLLK